MGHLAGPKLGVGETGCWRRGEALRVHFAPARSRQAPHVTVCISADLWTTLPTGSSRSSAAVIALLFFSPSSPPLPSFSVLRLLSEPKAATGGEPGCSCAGSASKWFPGRRVCVFFLSKNDPFPFVSAGCISVFLPRGTGGSEEGCGDQGWGKEGSKAGVLCPRGSPRCGIAPDRWQLRPLSSLR